jgi:protein TonB
MTSADHNRFLLPAWSVSLLLHAIVVFLAAMFVGQVKPVLQTETFKWDVTFVEPATPEAISGISEPVDPPVRAASPRPSEPMPDMTMNRVAPQRSAQVVHPKVEQPKPIEQKVDEPPKLEPLQPAAEVQETIDPIEQKAVGAPKPEPMTQAKEAEPVTQNEPVVAQSHSVQHSTQVEAAEPSLPQAPVSPQPAVEPPPEAHAQQATRLSPVVEPTPPAAPPAAAAAPSDAPAQVAKAAPTPEGKVDHRWVGESLWRRVAELKRYPTSARLNGQEGKVILKAVIRSDGQLAEVTILKSSGHHILDSAALEAVKLACPLHMKQAINKPEIVVSLPIVYSLAN